VIAPRHEARSNHEVIRALAHRLGARHAGFDMTAWELIDATLVHSGFAGAEELAQRRWIDLAPNFETAHFLNGFGHPGGRFRFKPDWGDAALPAFPDHAALIDESDDQHPYRLITAPAHNFLNSSFNETPSSRKAEVAPTAMIHPADLARLKLTDGATVRLGNAQGSLLVATCAFEGVQPGVVIVEGLWGNADFKEGAGINLLTSADVIPPLGGAPFHDTKVWLRAP
jgi:anaerobic selenocysteine-containing dehydrogenase